MESNEPIETEIEEKARFFDLLISKPWNVNVYPKSDGTKEYIVVNWLRGCSMSKGNTAVEAIRLAIKTEKEGI